MESRENRGRGGRGRGGKSRGGRGRGSKSRGRVQTRGRGGRFYPKSRGNSRNQNLDSNEWRFKDQEEENLSNSLRRETYENCLRELIQSNALSEYKDYSNEQVQKMEELISKLSIEEQINYDFIVPMPPLDNSSVETKDKKDESKDEDKNEEHENKATEQQENLNDWLDNLLG